jgi:DNA invertase Pin-like site-specific DNA recombinase
MNKSNKSNKSNTPKESSTSTSIGRPAGRPPRDDARDKPPDNPRGDPAQGEAAGHVGPSELVRPEHLRRQAVVYVRQSSPGQVLGNAESRRLQYELRRRAVELGWREQDVRVVDCDLGHSAATAAGRVGFRELVADVALGKVGIILAYDPTRLARNCSDWYPLLDTCAGRGCLLGDRDGVYDPASVNGRMLLGLKGQISELELYTIRARLGAGLLSKARRGELALGLPAGLQRDASGRVLKHPDREVQGRVGLVFDAFQRLGSAAAVVRELRGAGLGLPRRDRFGDVAWRPPNQAGVCSILKNPAYAGAFVYGRTRGAVGGAAAHPGAALRRPVPEEQWRVCVRDKYPAYVSWESYQKVQSMLRDNHAEYRRNQTRGAPRDGEALLHGIAWCGECGHKMFVQYKRGTRYVCNHLRQQFGEPVCQVLPAGPLDACAAGLFMRALSAAELDLHDAVMAEARGRRRRERAAAGQQLHRLRYLADLARRQYDRCDPDNRLVAAELEQRWEQALAELKLAEEAEENAGAAGGAGRGGEREPDALSPALREALQDLGVRLPGLWPQLPPRRRKALVRCLVEKVVLRRNGDAVVVRVVWRGGDVSEELVAVPVRSVQDLLQFDQMQQEAVKLAKQGLSDRETARRLTAAGFRSPTRQLVLPSTARELRIRGGVLRHSGHPRAATKPGFLSVSQLARKLGVLAHRVYDRIHSGVIRPAKDKKTKTYLFPDRPGALAKLRKLVVTEPGNNHQ